MESVYQNATLKQFWKMDIDLTTIIISAIASLFFIIPIVIDQLKKREEDESKEETSWMNMKSSA